MVSPLQATWICGDCVIEAGGDADHRWSTWHLDKCDVCGQMKAVAASADFTYSADLVDDGT